MMGFGKDNTARIARDQRQETINQWAMRVFGARFITRFGRTERVIEEAIELAQALDFPKERIVDLVEKVYAKPKGEVPQEIGGLSTCLLSLGQTLGYSVDQLEQNELNRVLLLPDDHFKRKLAEKIAAGIQTEEAA